MLDFRRDKPVIIHDRLPAEIGLTMEPGVPDEVKVELWDAEKKRCHGTLGHVRNEGCVGYFLIDTSYAKLGAGQYLLRVFDGCHCCDELWIKLSRKCFVSAVTIDTAKGVCC